MGGGGGDQKCPPTVPPDASGSLEMTFKVRPPSAVLWVAWVGRRLDEREMMERGRYSRALSPGSQRAELPTPNTLYLGFVFVLMNYGWVLFFLFFNER